MNIKTDAKTITVLNEISSTSALTREQGKIIFDIISPILEASGDVILDFEGIESIITPFLNVSIGKLYENNSGENLQKHLQIVNLPKGMAAKFTLVIENAKNFYKNSSAFINARNEVLSDNEE